MKFEVYLHAVLDVLHFERVHYSYYSNRNSICATNSCVGKIRFFRVRNKKSRENKNVNPGGFSFKCNQMALNGLLQTGMSSLEYSSNV